MSTYFYTEDELDFYYKPTDRCLGSGCYRQVPDDDWDARVRREHGERIQFRNLVNGRKDDGT